MAVNAIAKLQFLSFISTYIHVEALTPLGRFMVKILYKQVATNTQEIEPMELERLCISSIVSERNKVRR